MPIAAIIQLGKLILMYGPTVVSLITGIVDNLSKIESYLHKDQVAHNLANILNQDIPKAEKIRKLQEIKCYTDSCVIK